MDCTKCERPIEGDLYENAVFAEVMRSPTGIPMGRYAPVFHFECVDDPARLQEDEFQKYAAWWMERERERREAFQEHVDAELALIHRALHALPHHLNQAYIDDIYGEPETSAREHGLIAGNCTSCGRPVFYNGERDRNCKLVFVGHASSCGGCPASTKYAESHCLIKNVTHAEWLPQLECYRKVGRQPRGRRHQQDGKTGIIDNDTGPLPRVIQKG